MLVLTGQAMAAQGLGSCEMDLHQMDSQIDHSAMGHDIIHMDKADMSCCDDKACAMDCSLVMTLIVSEQSSFVLAHKALGKASVLSTSTTKRSSTSLFRPPISA